MSSSVTGLLGEMRAAVYLRKKGMRFVASRFRTPHGEIDLIMQDGESLVFVEVKTRPRGHISSGLQAVNAEKRRHLRYAAQCYLAEHPAERVRMDVIEISASGILHIKNAF